MESVAAGRDIERIDRASAALLDAENDLGDWGLGAAASPATPENGAALRPGDRAGGNRSAEVTTWIAAEEDSRDANRPTAPRKPIRTKDVSAINVKISISKRRNNRQQPPGQLCTLAPVVTRAREFAPRNVESNQDFADLGGSFAFWPAQAFQFLSPVPSLAKIWATPSAPCW